MSYQLYDSHKLQKQLYVSWFGMKQFIFIKRKINFIFIYDWLCVGDHESQKKVSDPLELEYRQL